METKLFEIRDVATFIPVVAIQCDPANEKERYLLARAGYAGTSQTQKTYVLMANIDGRSELRYSAESWHDRTYTIAHEYIQANFDKLDSGDVIDVEYILGINSTAKLSERLTNRYENDE